ncbi:lysophospholipid acyltransferase 5 isoform X2 [Harmonia axyridis]|uniref:lysophospholipid acyltransferase 5 isoform X2 n=1 Tax=Harmonia axyridis TaxID=115357 RepID=UPI001E278D36|nr:lysophospholipid acyltransferase 5 isoform X2 [Harmonia axyridis]
MFGLAIIIRDALKPLSVILGTDIAALLLLLSILSAYPFAIFYRKFIYGREKIIQHLYFVTTGLILGYVNYGNDMIHPLAAMAASYAFLAFLGGTSLAVAAVFIFNMLYLLIGYYIMSTDSYDINWTMPHCVLVLRLIGVAFDYYDGQQNEEKLGTDSKKYMLKYLPNPLEFLGFACFPASFMVGPQFPMKRYQNFIDGQFGDKDPLKAPESEIAALRRFGLGLLYLLLFQLLGMLVSDDFIISEGFERNSFFWKHILLGVWGRYTLYRYISCWLLAEGGCILFGITYNGIDENGKKEWNGLQNIKLSLIENTKEFGDYIKSFNINTNHWVAHYIFKRLKFLGNRNLSQLGALFFLAVWHGYHSGYFLTFFVEFLVIYMERDIKYIIKANQNLSQFFDQAAVDIVVSFILRIYSFIFMGFCLIPFVFLTFEKYWVVLGHINYSGLIMFGLYPVIWGPILRAIVVDKRRD